MSVIIVASPTKETKKMKPLRSGNLLADGTEQTLLEFQGVAKIVGYVDLSNMTVGDTVTIRQYMKLTPEASYKKYAEQTLTGVQPEPLLYITPKETDVAILITLQQTAGTFKRYPHNFMEED
jgi:hypothetical protein